MTESCILVYEESAAGFRLIQRKDGTTKKKPKLTLAIELRKLRSDLVASEGSTIDDDGRKQSR